MTPGTLLAVYSIKVAAVAFVSITVLAVMTGMAFSVYSGATGARVSAGTFFLQAEDFFWIAVVSAVIGAVAAVVRYLRRS